jgi:limonene-1,2-epoxide hydrolase
MQAEAGEGLAAIVARKERERQAGNGLFFWGVGNAPALMTKVLAGLNHPVRVVFSIMKGKPKVEDTSPRQTLVWRKYLDIDGIERDLPPNALITSRAATKSAIKKRHFALMCFSNAELRITHGAAFDPHAYRNAGGTGAAVGASQVTALLRRTGSSASTSGYEVNLQAQLIGSYWVRLTEPVVLSSERLSMLEDQACVRNGGWFSLVSCLREGQKHLIGSNEQEKLVF